MEPMLIPFNFYVYVFGHQQSLEQSIEKLVSEICEILRSFLHFALEAL